MQIRRKNGEAGVVLEGGRGRPVAPSLVAMTLAAPDGVVELPPRLEGVARVPPLGSTENLSSATCWPVSAKNDENVLMYAATSRRSASDNRPFQAGIALPGSPSSIARIRSASVGSWPEAVVRIL